MLHKLNLFSMYKACYVKTYEALFRINSRMMASIDPLVWIILMLRNVVRIRHVSNNDKINHKRFHLTPLSTHRKLYWACNQVEQHVAHEMTRHPYVSTTIKRDYSFAIAIAVDSTILTSHRWTPQMWKIYIQIIHFRQLGYSIQRPPDSNDFWTSFTDAWCPPSPKHFPAHPFAWSPWCAPPNTTKG